MIFENPALNTFDVEVVKERLAWSAYELAKKEDIPVQRLDKLLD